MLREASEGYESWAAHYSVGVNERARDGVFVTYEGPSLSVRWTEAAMTHREHVCVLCVVQSCLKRTPNALQASRTSHVPAGASVRVVYGTFHKVMRWGRVGW